MSVPWQSIDFHSFSGGLDTQAGPFTLNPTEADTMDNWITDIWGSLVLRPGYGLMSSYTDSTTPISTCLFQYRPEGGTAMWLRMASNADADAVSLRSYNSATGNWDNIAATGFTPSGHVNCVAVQFQNQVFFANGVDILSMYDQATGTWTAVANSPVANFVLVHYGRIWTNNTADPSAVRCCADGDPATWTGSDSLTYYAGRGDGDVVVAGFSLYERLLVFKRDRIFLIHGNDATTYEIGLVRGDAGALSVKSVVAGENLVYFLSEKGIYATDGDTIMLVSNQIRPERFNTNRNMDSRVIGLHNRRDNLLIFGVAASGSSTLNRALAYRYQPRFETSREPELGSWSRFTTWPFNEMAVFQDTVTPTDDDVLLAGDYSGHVFLLARTLAGVNIGTDNTAVLTSDLRFAWNHGGDESRLKRFRRILVTLTDIGVSPAVTYGTRLDAGFSAYWVQPRLEVYSDSGTARGRLSFYADFNEATPAAGPFTPSDWNGLTRVRVDGAKVFFQPRTYMQPLAA